jgi:uncharacterized protein with FMN-binding domain
MISSHSRIRRAAGLGGLLAGIGLVVTLKTATASQAPTGQLALPPGNLAPASSSAAAGGSAGSSAPTSSSASSSTSAGAGSNRSTGPVTVTGGVADTPYGPVQVQLTITNGKITDSKALQTPSSASRSVRLAAMATPILRQEVLSAQSARIDTVSGATYTSEGYAQSVQSALDNAPH